MLNPETPPEISAAQWFNADPPPQLASLKGKVVVMGAFQIACPGSTRHLVPQLERLQSQFQDDEVAVIGLHTVFEQHEAQSPAKLGEFIEEHELTFPIAFDKPNGGPLPETMEAYELQGTPTLLVFDRQGRLRRHYLGQVDDMRLAAEVMALTIEARDAPREQSIALERRLASVLVDPNAHKHEGGCCGGGHHNHDHHHDHAGHAHGDGCCGGAHNHDHDHHHGHDHHGHDHHDHHHHAHDGKQQANAAVKADKGGCGDSGCGCKG